MTTFRGLAVLTAYAATIPLANWLIGQFGLWPVGFGLMAPAGVYAAGLALALRDGVHETLGTSGALAGIALGVALSLLVAPPKLALASAVAFGLSELADFIVYAPLRRRRLILAVALSGAAGLIIDSALFVWLACGSLGALPGQIVGKTWITLLTIGVVAAAHWARPRKPVMV